MNKLLIPLFLLLAICPDASSAADPQLLADVIDRRISEAWKAAQITPAPLADDSEFLRRITLDLTGRIPSARDVRDFLADRSPDKRRQRIIDLLASPRHAVHFANVWRALLIPETESNNDARYFQAGFESWLRNRWRGRVPYDQMVAELISAPISNDEKTAQTVLQDPTQANPFAFYAVKSAQPENLAAATARMFLGLQLECAQCHDHPFATWSQEQFWKQAAFFAGIQRAGDSLFAPLTELPNRRELELPNKKGIVKAVFLDDQQPDWQPDVSSRMALARWITSPQNRYFSRATVNRLWAQFFGIGIVEPVDDFHDEHPPSHPELLEDLANGLVNAQFDIQHVVSAICMSHAYQRTSHQTHLSQETPRQFARMSVKRLSGEQFFDSLAFAIGYHERIDKTSFDRDRNSPREKFLAQFSSQGRVNEPESSILQALTLMNGSFLRDATNPGGSSTLTAVAAMPHLNPAERIDMLYLTTLSRLPTAVELERLTKYLAKDETDASLLADIFWVLLNSAEFRLNH